MRYSRAGVVAVLLGAEAFIAGGIISQARGLRPEFSTGSTTAYAFAAGDTPHVVVDDRDSRIYVEPSDDGRVHVQDDSRSAGLIWSTARRAPLSVQRTDDGVAVRRAASGGFDFAMFGFSDEAVRIRVPQAAVLEVRGCDGATLSGLRAESITVDCQDGSIHGTDLALGGGTLHTADGSIRVALASSDVTVHAMTGDGSLRVDGHRIRSGEDRSETTFQMGAGTGRLEIATGDGSVRITTGRAQ